MRELKKLFRPVIHPLFPTLIKKQAVEKLSALPLLVKYKLKMLIYYRFFACFCLA
jgi:hypothetical protein